MESGKKLREKEAWKSFIKGGLALGNAQVTGDVFYITSKPKNCMAVNDRPKF